VRYLLDSTLLIDHANGDAGAATMLRRLYEEPSDLYTCDVVSCEALSGGDPDDVRHIETLLDALDYVATTPTAARDAGEARRSRRAAGGRRALGDALIAAIARDLDATIVTRNRPDFIRQGVPVLEY
jgi:predicted nucleic acid-binding protein